MKLSVIGLLAVAALVFVLAFSAAAPAAPNSPTGIAAPTATTHPAVTTAAAADHPEIHEAIGALRRAREHLAHAKHDFGGHREEAVRATDEAIRQLEICLKYD
jgi:hypothetical protein